LELNPGRWQENATMAATKEYWECARECARLAVETKDREAKNHLLDMAQAWTEPALLEAGIVWRNKSAAGNQLIASA
jgi:hypothetical protein